MGEWWGLDECGNGVDTCRLFWWRQISCVGGILKRGNVVFLFGLVEQERGRL